MSVPPPPAPEPRRDTGNGVLIVAGLIIAVLIGAAIQMKRTGSRLPQFVEDALGAIFAVVLIAAVVIYRILVARNARL